MNFYRRRFLNFIKPSLHLVAIIASMVMASGTSTAGERAKQILFFGDSLTAGYGIDPAFAYPAIVRGKIEAAALPAEVTVGAVSGDTSAGGLRRIDWMLRQPVDIFVLALGANDGLRGVAPATTKDNLQAILDKVKARYPEATLVVAGMRIPPSLGQDYVRRFAAIYPQLAEDNDATLIPFLLEDVGGRLDLNLADRIHPNAAGHAIVGKTIWNTLKPLLTKN